jgi:hypothetical protein
LPRSPQQSSKIGTLNWIASGQPPRVVFVWPQGT